MRSGVIDGRFRLLGEIGAGGMGRVYRARDERLGVDVAVKLLRQDLEIDAARFLREGELLASVSHPSIVRFVQHGQTEDGQLYLAMEWIEGVTLAQRLDRVGLSVAESVAVVAGLARALDAAHTAGIVHRDLKPSNLMLVGGEPTQVKLIDLGVARRFDQIGSLTRTGTAMGTPGYMAPEQARGLKGIDSKADVFALGCILYECLTGRAAFAGANPLAVMTKVVLMQPPPLRYDCPEAPERLGSLLTHMLEKDPRARLGPVGAVASALEALGTLPDAPRRPARLIGEEITKVAVAGTAGRSFVVLASPDEEHASGAGAPPVPPGEALATALGALGANVRVLLDGTVIALVDGPDALDAAERAARVAMQLRARLPGYHVVAASGRAQAQRDPVDEAIDAGARAIDTSLLEGIFAEITDGGVGEVRVDEQLAALLASRFRVERRRGACFLKGEAA